jgi:hypothetical protein
MATLPQFRQRQLARMTSRRTSNIDRLAKQYARSVESMTSDYERMSAENARKMNEQMAPFEASMAKYKTALDEYTTNIAMPYQRASEQFSKDAATYAQKEAAYASELAQIATGSRNKTARSYEAVAGKQGSYEIYDFFVNDPNTGQRIPLQGPQGVIQNPSMYGYDYVLTPAESGNRGTNIYTFVPKPSSPDPGQAPVAPKKPAEFAMEMPKAPDITQFDGSDFEAKRSQLESEFKREVGERRAARMNVTRRGTARPLLQGEKA